MNLLVYLFLIQFIRLFDPNIEDRLVPLKFENDKDFLEGELAVSSPAVTSGKLDEKIIVPHYELDGKSYIRTRDLVKMSRDGIFTFESKKRSLVY